MGRKLLRVKDVHVIQDLQTRSIEELLVRVPDDSKEPMIVGRLRRTDGSQPSHPPRPLCHLLLLWLFPFRVNVLRRTTTQPLTASNLEAKARTRHAEATAYLALSE